MMKNAKMNEKGKLLAIIAVFAMVFAGAAVVMSSEGVDAVDAAPYVATDIGTTDALPAEINDSNKKTAYYADGSVKETTLKITTGDALNVTVFVKSGVTVTFNGIADDKITLIIIGYYVDAEKKNMYNAGTSVDTKITVKPLVADEKFIVTPTTVAGKDTTMKIGGAIKTTATPLTIVLGALGAGAVTIDESIVLKDEAAIGELPWAYSYLDESANVYTVYEKPLKSYTYKVEDTGTDVFTINSVGASATVTATVKVTYLDGTTEAVTNFSLKDAKLAEETLVFTMKKDAKPQLSGGDAKTNESTGTIVTLDKGFATAKASSAEDGFKGTFNAVANNTTATEYYAQIYFKAGDSTADPVVPDVVYATISGTVTQSSNVTLNSGTLTVATGNKLIVKNTTTITIKTTPAITGSVDLFGNLVKDGAVSEADVFGANSTIMIGPNAYSNLGKAGTAVLQNFSADGIATVLGGTIGGTIVWEGDLQINGTKDATHEVNLIIPEGVTFTITGDFGLNGQKILVNGKLIVNGSVYSTAFVPGSVTAESNAIVVGPKGSVEIGGDLAVNTYVGISLDGDIDVIVRGVDGLVYAPITFENETAPGIWGDLAPCTSSYKDVGPIVILKDDKNVIPLPLNISKGVTLDIQAGTVEAGGLALINLEGTLKSTALNGATLELNSLSSIVINGLVQNVDIIAYQGEVTKDGTIGVANVKFTLAHSIVAGTGGKNTLSYAAGLTVTVTPATEDKKDYQRVYIEGELTIVNVTTTDAATTATKPSITIAANGAATAAEVYIGEGDELTIPAEDKLGFTVGAADKPVTFVVEGKVARAVNALSNPYIGAYYVIESGTPKTETHYYEPLDDALESFDLAKGKKIEVSVKKIDSTFSVADKQTLLFVDGSATVIADGATVTFESGSIQSGDAIADVQGVLIQKNGARLSAEPEKYASKITTPEGDIIYAGLQAVHDLANPGDTIIINDGKTDGNLNVKAGLTVRITGKEEVGGDYTIEEGAIVILESTGEIHFFGKKAHNLNVYGELDADEGSITKQDAEKDTIKADVTGIMSVVSTTAVDGFEFTGATYETSSGVVMTTINKAIPGAIEAAIDFKVTIHGKVVWTADLIVEKVTIVFKNADASFTAGNIDIDNATIDVTTGTFSGPVNDTFLLGSVSAEFTSVKGIIISSIEKHMILEGTVTAGDIDIVSGLGYIGDLTIKTGTTFTVHEHSTTTVLGNMKVDGAAFLVMNDGIVNVLNGGVLDLISGKNIVYGTLAALKADSAGTINITKLNVPGTITNVDATINVLAPAGLVIGEEPTSIGAANGTIIGNYKVGDNLILLYAGAVFNEMKIDSSEKPKTTQFIINGTLYMYMMTSGTSPLDDTVVSVPDYKLPGYDGTGELKKATTWGLDGSSVVGKPDVVSVHLDKSAYAVMISPIKGMSIVVDSITYSNNADPELVVGVHKVSFQMSPGYKVADGTTLTLNFNGKAITGDTFEITPAMKDMDLTLTATGTIVIDQDIPEQEKQDDTIIIILLAILVVMVVILAIVTILRMMRS